MESTLPAENSATASRAVRVPISDIKRYADGWLIDSEYRQLAAQTLYSRRTITDKLMWWLKQQEYDTCGTMEIRAFLTYVAVGDEKLGRWGNVHEKTKNRPVTVSAYYNRLKAFFQFLVNEGYLTISPMASLKPPIVRADQIQPFTEEQVASLLKAAKQSKFPRRNEAIILFLLDTGVRVSELCDLKQSNVDLTNRRAVVHGKGNKHRTVYLSKQTAKVLWQYLQSCEEETPDEPNQDRSLFSSHFAEPFTRSGLLQLIQRLGTVASIEATRCSPHTFRHTCAIWFLRNGGQVFALKEMLGHTDLKMTARYVALAQADVQNQHAKFSPVERLRKGARK